jgi:hypothetical protein
MSSELLTLPCSPAQGERTLVSRPAADRLSERAAEVFADQLAGDRVPSIRGIRARLHVGQMRRSDCGTTSLRVQGQMVETRCVAPSSGRRCCCSAQVTACAP